MHSMKFGNTQQEQLNVCWLLVLFSENKTLCTFQLIGHCKQSKHWFCPSILMLNQVWFAFVWQEKLNDNHNWLTHSGLWTIADIFLAAPSIVLIRNDIIPQCDWFFAAIVVQKSKGKMISTLLPDDPVYEHLYVSPGLDVLGHLIWCKTYASLKIFPLWYCMQK